MKNDSDLGQDGNMELGKKWLYSGYILKLSDRISWQIEGER